MPASNTRPHRTVFAVDDVDGDVDADADAEGDTSDR